MGPSSSSTRRRSHGGPSSTLLLPLPRVLLLKLAVLFFVAHPGSAATWADPRAFLLHLRYPNRDLDVPRAFGAVQQQQQQQQQAQQRQRGKGTPPLLFVGPRVVAAPSPATNQAKVGSRVGAGAVRPLNVVIGSFVSELERSPQDGRRKLFKPVPAQQQQPQAQQPQPMLRWPVLQQQQVQAQQAQQPAVVMAATTTQGGQPQGGQPSQKPPQVRGGFAMIPLPSLPPAAAPQQLMRLSAATLVDVYDGVLSFVGSRLVTTEQTLSRALLGGVSALTSAGAGAVGSSLTGMERHSGGGGGSSNSNAEAQSSPSSSSSAMPSSLAASRGSSYDLVGFLDLDPFEKSKRYFKRSSKMLL